MMRNASKTVDIGKELDEIKAEIGESEGGSTGKDEKVPRVNWMMWKMPRKTWTDRR